LYFCKQIYLQMKNKPKNCATWIWYPGDYEIWLGNLMNNRRTERGVFFPPFWKMDSHYVLVEFSKQFELEKEEIIEIHVEGQYNIKLDGKMFPQLKTLHIAAGKHSLHIKVYNQGVVPTIFVRGETLISDNTWRVTCEDKEWIDESGKASDTSCGTTYLLAGSWNFNSPTELPSAFTLATEPAFPVSEECKKNGILYDFGKETFGQIVFNKIKGNGKLNLYYGESPEEALDAEHCELFDSKEIDICEPTTLTEPSRAFRYLYVEKDATIEYNSISMLYEFLPEEYKGSFRCNDELLNRIFDVSAYTLHLTTREFFIDGIKRDRWTWSGDAAQSYLMNYYLFFDSETVKRTILQLRGKDPVTSHINTIVDYTFYWFISIYDYYKYSGDRDFVALIYPRMKTLMDYCLSRRNSDGMMEGLVGDWVFIDWADFSMSKAGEVSFEQLLFHQSLKAMAACAEIIDLQEDKNFYNNLSDTLQQRIFDKFWDKNAFIHNVENGNSSEQITPFVNMFAILFDFVNAEKREQIKQNVLLNPDALKITTPYMRFYELEALCQLDEYQYVLDEIRSYWGGMLELGATSFWEKYNPEQSGVKHLEMYGRPYGKSLCHSWGASPLYLFGKYLLGVKPEKAGYKEFSIRPNLCDLQWIEGEVPTPNGKISVFMDNKTLKISASEGEGWLYIKSSLLPEGNFEKIEKTDENSYKLWIESGKLYEVKYFAV
jgi:Glycogen debranching enzyme